MNTQKKPDSLIMIFHTDRMIVLGHWSLFTDEEIDDFPRAEFEQNEDFDTALQLTLKKEFGFIPENLKLIQKEPVYGNVVPVDEDSAIFKEIGSRYTTSDIPGYWDYYYKADFPGFEKLDHYQRLHGVQDFYLVPPVVAKKLLGIKPGKKSILDNGSIF